VGVGQVITGTFRHLHDGVRLLKLQGLPQPVEVTGKHPIFSEDRQDFVRVQDLNVGERLRTRSGVTVVESIADKPGEWQVFNLEIGVVHRYYVSALDVLAHNECFASIESVRASNRSVAEVAELRAQFDSYGRTNFLKRYAKTAEAIENLTESQLKILARGKIPKSLRAIVHHVEPLFRGGTNAFENLALVKRAFHRKNYGRLHLYPKGESPPVLPPLF
jgi:hypothetical protein